MELGLDRRGFLRLSGLAAASLALPPRPPSAGSETLSLARVATTWVGLYTEPAFRSKALGRLVRDEILSPEQEVTAEDGPPHNPLWYRVAGGYVHSGNLQLVRWQPQVPLLVLPADGALFEVSVPFTRSRRGPDPSSDPLYRLYYQSTHWVERTVDGADGRPWYQIVDDVLYIRYFVPAEHLRRVRADELTPVGPDVPAHRKRIEVSLARQELLAFEGDRLVLHTRISSGIPDSRPLENGVPTVTPDGVFYVTKKTPMRHMGDGHITPDLEAYELPGVPWVSFFHETGVAFHGTYWHTDFGRPRSHGCINMRPEEAKWIYRWTLPHAGASDRLRIGRGTTVIVS